MQKKQCEPIRVRPFNSYFDLDDDDGNGDERTKDQEMTDEQNDFCSD